MQLNNQAKVNSFTTKNTAIHAFVIKPVTLKKHQQGMTFIGTIFVIAAVVFFAMLGLKVGPAYLEYMNIKNAVKKLSNEAGFASMSKKELADAFNRSAQIDDFTSVTGADLIIEKNEVGNVVSAKYQKVIPVFANASVLLDFNASSAK